MGTELCGRRGQPLPASELAPGRAMRSRKRALRPGRGERGAPPRASAAQELAQAGLRAAGAARGAPETCLVVSKTPAVDPHAGSGASWFLVASASIEDSARAVELKLALGGGKARPWDRADASAAPDARHAAPWHARAASGPSLPKSLSAHLLQRSPVPGDGRREPWARAPARAGARRRARRTK